MPLIRSLADVTNDEVALILSELDARGGSAPVTVEEKRRAYREAVHRSGAPAPVAEVIDEISPGGTPVRVYRPEPAGVLLPVVLYLHGGGFLSGDLETHDPLCRTLANRVPALVVAVQYRLAPENPFPAAMDDCVSVLEWLPERAARAGGDPEKLFVAGDSAGGNLAAVAALNARDRKHPALAGQVLIYPMLDASLSAPSLVENALIPPFTLLDCVYAWQQYLRPDLDRRMQQVTPLLAPSLFALPPALVITAGFDILRDEALRYVDRMRAAGVPVTHHHFSGMVHGFFQWTAQVTAARTALDLTVQFLRSV